MRDCNLPAVEVASSTVHRRAPDEGAFDATPCLVDAFDDTHLVTGHDGYWPVRARGADPRLGGATAREGLVADAHVHGIRVLLDDVINDVHQDHEYVARHPG